MAKRTSKTKHLSVLEAVEQCTRRDSDLSDLEASEEDSDVSDVDSVAEAMFCDGMDSVLDR